MSLVYAMSISGEVVKFLAGAHSKPIGGDKANGYDLEWWVFEIMIPTSLESRRDEVLQLIEEAKVAEKSGFMYGRENIKTVKTHFTKPPKEMDYFA